MQIKKWFKRSLILIPVALGISAVLLAPKLKKPPQKIETLEVATKVRIIKPLYEPVSPKALGYGTTKPTRSWEAVAEVSGRIIWVSQRLKTGTIIPKGTELLKIDASEYKLALAQINAQINTSSVRTSTTNRSLSVEQRTQLSLRKEVLRQKKLNTKGMLPSSTLESAERNLIKSDATVQTLRNSLAIIEAEKQSLIIQRQNAELDLARTTIKAPFDVRIVSINVQEARFASKGLLLFSADSTDKTEIEAHFPLGQLRPLIANDIDKGKKRQMGALSLKAIVRLHTSTHSIEWKATVERVSGQIDRQTQTSGVIVGIDAPYEKAIPGERPPLIRNTFVEVELRGNPKGKQVIIPITAIHENKVYLLDEENRLDIRNVKVLFSQDRYAIITDGIKPEDKLIVSDLVPAIQGMLLHPIKDNKTRKVLMRSIGTAPAEKEPSNKESSK